MSVAWQRVLFGQVDPSSSVHARCQALGLYYQPCGESDYNLELIRLLDEKFMQNNSKGVFDLRAHLRLAGPPGQLEARRLVHLMGHEPDYPKPRLSMPDQDVTPYP